jgi:hypothetical protein
MNIDEEIPALYAEDYKLIQRLNGWALCEMMSEAVIEIPDLRARVPPFSGLSEAQVCKPACNSDQGGRTEPWTGLGCISEVRAVLHGTARTE